jgi:hypothetical protein
MRGVPAGEFPGIKSIFWGGMPDILDQQGGVFFGLGQPQPLVYAYNQTIVQTLQAALFNGNFGWLGQTSSPGVAIASIRSVVVANGGYAQYLTIGTNILAGSTNVVNNPLASVPIRISGIQQPGNLNGIWPMTVQGPNSDGTYTLYFKKRIAVLPWVVGGQAAYQPKNFIGYSNLWVGPTANGMINDPTGNIYVVKVAKRKRGVPFGQQRGRRKALSTY